MDTGLRFVRLLALVVWVGGLIFFAFILAPTAFHILPTIRLAGMVVGQTLHTFHLVALVAGTLFCLPTLLLARRSPVLLRGRYRVQLLLAALMLVLTSYLQASILPAMEVDRAHAGGDIDAVPRENPARLHFDKLHVLSERLEGGVLFAGLGVLLVIAGEPARTAL